MISLEFFVLMLMGLGFFVLVFGIGVIFSIIIAELFICIFSGRSEKKDKEEMEKWEESANMNT